MFFSLIIKIILQNQIITSVEDAGLFPSPKNNIGEPPNHIQSG